MNSSTMNYLFFLGIVIPSIVTVILFVVFCYCWWRIKVRHQILYKKHDPHGIDRLKDGVVYEPPPPPRPPFKSKFELSDLLNHNDKKESNDNYEESPEPTDGIDNPTLYRTAPDSGFCELNDIQFNMPDNAAGRSADNNRPKSEASDDSDDSGFRSSRSGQYNHSASSSNGNAQEALHGVASCQVHDIVPLFKPIRIHPDKADYQPYQISYGERYSAKQRRQKQRKSIPPSHHYTTDMSAKSHINSPPVRHLPNTSHLSQKTSGSHVGPTFGMNHVTQSNYDVHGGRLHTIDTHVRPLHSSGPINHLNSQGHCGHVNSVEGCHGNQQFGQFHSLQSDYNGNPQFGQFHSLQSDGLSVHSNSIGYISDLNRGNQISHISGSQFDTNQISHISGSQFDTNQMSQSGSQFDTNQISHKGLHSDYNANKHFQPIQPDLNSLGSPLLQSRHDTQIPLTFTQATVHRPYIEELSDPTLFSVV